MALKPYYTSSTLIEAVKRNQSIPISQITYSDEDILAFATEELFLSQVPSILQYHEEYYVYSQDLPLIGGKSRYPIPARAIGMKLRDVYYVDTQGQLVEMNKVNPDDESYFSTDSNSNPTPVHFKVQNNAIVIIPEVTQTAQGKIRFTYYLRPNSLVKDELAAVSTGFSKGVTVDNASLVAGDTLTIGGQVFTADTDFAIGANSSITATNLGSALTAAGIASTVSGPLCTVMYYDRTTSFSASNPAGLQIQVTINIMCSSVPDVFTEGTIVDILQADAGHNTLNIDVHLAPGSISTNSLTFNEKDIPEDFVVGDYICRQYECIIPQIPTDLHTLLAERTCARILESLGDKQGLDTAKAKINDLEARQATVIDNRVEGSPTKVFNRHSLLRYGKTRFGRGRR